MADGGPPLATGWIAQVVSLPTDAAAAVPPNCLVQALDWKALRPQNEQVPATGPPRFRLQISDGAYQTSVLLSTQLSQQVADGTLNKLDILHIQGVLVNYIGVPPRRVVIIAEAANLGKFDAVIGNPVEVTETGSGLAAAPSNSGTIHPPNSVYGGGGNQHAAPNPYQAQPATAQYQAPAAPVTPAPYGSHQPNAYGGPSANTAAPYGAAAAAPYGGAAPTNNPYGGGNSVYGGGAYGGPQNAAARPAPGGNQGNPYGAPAANPIAPMHGAGPYGATGPQYNHHGSAPIARDGAVPRIIPIKDLNPYIGRWTVKARCTAKGELRRFSGKNGEGKLFSFDLLDKDGGEIRCTVWNQEVDEFYPKVQVGSVYIVSQASLVNKKPDFNSTNHAFEMRLERKSQLELCQEDDDARVIPTIQYHFKRIEELEVTEAKTIVDVIGVVESVDAWQTLTKRNGEETKKRAVIIRDQTARSIEVTLWGQFVGEPGDQLEQMVKAGDHPVLAVKGARIGDFNGKTLSTLNSSHVAVNPDIPDAAKLRHWYDSSGAQTAAQPLSESRGGGQGQGSKRCTLAQIRDENLGKRGAPDWITVAATIQYVQNEPGRIYYPACTKDFNGRMCNKKLVEQSAGQWWCERCQQFCQQPEYRYILSLTAGDHTGSQWLSAFGEAGEAIVGMPANELRRVEQESPERFGALIQDLQFKPLLFRLKVAEDNFNDEARIKCSVFSSNPVDYAKECKVLLDLVTKMELGQPVMQVPEPREANAAPGTWQPSANPATASGSGMGGAYNNPGRGTQGFGGGSGSYQGAGRGAGNNAAFGAAPPTQGGYQGGYQGTAPGAYQGGGGGGYQAGGAGGYQGNAPGGYQGGAPGAYQGNGGGGFGAGGPGGFSPGAQQGQGNGGNYGGNNAQYGGGGGGGGGQPFASGFA